MLSAFTAATGWAWKTREGGNAGQEPIPWQEILEAVHKDLLPAIAAGHREHLTDLGGQGDVEAGAAACQAHQQDAGPFEGWAISSPPTSRGLMSKLSETP